jgi:hypothetical protein
MKFHKILGKFEDIIMQDLHNTRIMIIKLHPTNLFLFEEKLNNKQLDYW